MTPNCSFTEPLLVFLRRGGRGGGGLLSTKVKGGSLFNYIHFILIFLLQGGNQKERKKERKEERKKENKK
jgi:hypothetical protein